MESAPELLDITRQYLAALEQMATGDALARFFSPEVVQEEFPNRLLPDGLDRWPDRFGRDEDNRRRMRLRAQTGSSGRFAAAA